MMSYFVRLKTVANVNVEKEKVKTMNDITREEAIERLKNMKMPFDLYFESGKEEIRTAIERGNKSLDIAIEALENQKMGHWIEVDLDVYECSECHEGQSILTKDNYCPNCGAKMEKEIKQ